jgi:hypothetical protein
MDPYLCVKAVWLQMLEDSLIKLDSEHDLERFQRDVADELLEKGKLKIYEYAKE